MVGEYPAAEAAADAAEAEAVMLGAADVDKGVGRKWMGNGGDCEEEEALERAGTCLERGLLLFLRGDGDWISIYCHVRGDV